MIDGCLPIEGRDRPLRYLFLDINSYFASVEQQDRPELRNRPMAVAPLDAETTFIIASSIEAKRKGIKTGTMVREARQKCPEIVIVPARPRVYVGYHHRILDVLGNVLPVEEVCSIDEMRFRLLGDERNPAQAREIALEMKRRLRTEVGEAISASIGIAPNSFLAKVGTDMQKPDGLVTLQADDLPHRLFGLQLTDFAGINRRMEARLNAAGMFTVEQMCTASRPELRQAFGSVIGERWWYLLRGYDMVTDRTDRKSLGHSHVLAPELRNPTGCREVLLRLLQKASARLRAENLWAKEMTIGVRAYEKSWQARVRMPGTQDTVAMNERFHEVWETRDFISPRLVSVTFHDLHPFEEVTPSLFDEDAPRRQLFNAAIDTVNQKFGKNSIYLAGLARAKDRADEKIAFNKTWLFSEGKGDNEWVDTFRGVRTAD
jgi:DNA polymerase IV